MQIKYGILGLTVSSILLAALFQNCAPQSFNSLDSASLGDLQTQGALSLGDIPKGSASQASNSNGVASSSSHNTSSNNAGIPNTASSAQDVGPQIFVQNGYIGAESYKIEMKSNGLATFENFFPFPKTLDSVASKNIFNDELWVSGDRSVARTNVEVCMSNSYTGCTQNSDYRSVAFSVFNVQTNLSYLKIENFWNTSMMKQFGDYYLFVKVQGVLKKALIQHRAYLALASGNRPSGTGFYHSTQGVNHYGFTCEQPGASEIGWTKYPYGTIANTSNAAYRTCYYRVLNNQQADDYYRAMYENKAPSLSITCPASGKAGQKISCGVTSWTPYSMKGEETWVWTVDGVNAAVGENLTVNSPNAGTYKVQLSGPANNGTVVKSNIVTVVISP